MIKIFRIIFFINITLFCGEFYGQNESFKVMAWNILHGGNDIENGQQNVVKIIEQTFLPYGSTQNVMEISNHIEQPS